MQYLGYNSFVDAQAFELQEAHGAHLGEPCHGFPGTSQFAALLPEVLE
jgi:hypothetical protein